MRVCTRSNERRCLPTASGRARAAVRLHARTRASQAEGQRRGPVLLQVPARGVTLRAAPFQAAKPIAFLYWISSVKVTLSRLQSPLLVRWCSSRLRGRLGCAPGSSSAGRGARGEGAERASTYAHTLRALPAAIQACHTRCNTRWRCPTPPPEGTHPRPGRCHPGGTSSGARQRSCRGPCAPGGAGTRPGCGCAPSRGWACRCGPASPRRRPWWVDAKRTGRAGGVKAVELEAVGAAAAAHC